MATRILFGSPVKDTGYQQQHDHHYIEKVVALSDRRALHRCSPTGLEAVTEDTL